jgi:heme oxygenase
MTGDAEQRIFMSHLKSAGLGVSEEQPAQHFAGAGNHRDRQVGADRQMAFGHALSRRVLPVSGIAEDRATSQRLRPEKSARTTAVARDIG